jgi:tight adherence protein C
MFIVQLSLAVGVFFAIYNGVEYYTTVQRKRRSSMAEVKRVDLSKKMGEFLSAIGQWGPNRALLERKVLRDSWERLLVRSGNPANWKVEEFLACKEVGLLLAIALIALSGMRNYLIAALIAALGLQLPDFYLKGKMATRMIDIQRRIPGFIDLVALAMESGLDFLAAVERIVDKMKPNALRDELGILIQETRLGTPRKESLQHLAQRVDLPDVQSLTSMIIQAEELGTSLATVLRTYAEDMRSKRILFAEEAAGKAPVKILMPMMVFFFPVIFVIVFGPVIYTFVRGTR